MKLKKLVLCMVLLLAVPHIALAQDGTNNSLEENETSTTNFEGEFRLPPVVKVRPVNDVIDKDNTGLIEFYFSNPTLNEAKLTADIYVSVPAGVHVSGEGFSTGGGAGTVHGHFVVNPGNDRTIYLDVVGEKLGTHFVHVEGTYYPNEEKDNFQQLSLTHPFKIVEPVSEPKNGSTSTSGSLPSLPLEWIILVIAVLGGIAIIFAVRRKPPKITIEDE